MSDISGESTNNRVLSGKKKLIETDPYFNCKCAEIMHG